MMLVTTKGQVTIPVQIRQKLGIIPHTEVDFVERGKHICLVKVNASKKKQPRKTTFERLQGIATVKMSTDDIMALTRG